MGGGGGEEVQVAEAIVFSTSGTECPTSRMGFARLLNENPPTAVQRDVGPPKLENDSFLPHLPYLAYSCIFQFPPREAF